MRTPLQAKNIKKMATKSTTLCYLTTRADMSEMDSLKA
jgi:hypothetical protein